MFGGLRKTSSRLTIAAAVGLLFGAVTHAAPVKAADLGGDCCADLEERVAELEATTVRKGTKKVSLTISGWVTKAIMAWDDGDETNVYIVDKFNTLSSHIKFSGSAQIVPGWSAGYLLHVEFPTGNGLTDSQFDDNGIGVAGLFSGARYVVEELQSALFIKSDQYGTVTLGKQSHTADNLALLPDLSGTIIESNAVFFEGNSFFLRPSGASGAQGLTGATWGNFQTCGSGIGGIGADCDGLPLQVVKYDSPTYMGFSFSADYGEDDEWAVALKYAGEFGDFKVSGAIGYSELTDERFVGGAGGGFAGNGNNRLEDRYLQMGGSVLHVPTGIFVYGLFAHEENDNLPADFGPVTGQVNNDENDVFYVKAGIKRTWTPWGATVLFGEFGSYNDQFGGSANACASGLARFAGGSGAAIGVFNPFNLVGAFCGTLVSPLFGGGGPLLNGAGGLNLAALEVTDSEVERWGLGVVQEVDAAALRLYARWQHSDLDLDFAATNTLGQRIGFGQGFEDLDIFMVGGTIFF